jgi:hypothetical protein
LRAVHQPRQRKRGFGHRLSQETRLAKCLAGFSIPIKSKEYTVSKAKISTAIMIALVAVQIRRDAMTIPIVTVPRHEITLLKKEFGKENVIEQEVVGSYELMPEAEQERLSNKYGADKVIAVYGDDNGERRAELVSKGKITAAELKKLKGGEDAEEESTDGKTA